MKKLLLISLVALSATSAYAQTPDSVIRFEELPFSEGTLYLQVNDNEKDILMKAVEVTEDNVTVPVDFSGLYDKELSVKAFLDLNENAVLDFDSYGRPTEACLQTVMTPKKDIKEYTLKLVEY